MSDIKIQRYDISDEYGAVESRSGGYCRACDVEDIEEDLAQSQLDLEQANFFLLDMEKGKYGRDYYANEVMKLAAEKRDREKELEKANKDIQVLAEALDRCVLYTKQFAHLSLNDQEKYQELANKYKDKA